MVCIYCGGKTGVSNSRHQKRVNHNWRRRECVSCRAIFTTIEQPEYGTSLAVQCLEGSKRRRIAPFSRDTLFTSVLKTVGHRKTAIADAGALTATIITKLLKNTPGAVVNTEDIVCHTLETLRSFDSVAAMQYEAYHK